MDLKICVGSACHLKNSREVIEEFKRLINEHDLSDKIELKGSFCMGRCSEPGVGVEIEGEVFSVLKDGAEVFFNTQVLRRL